MKRHSLFLFTVALIALVGCSTPAATEVLTEAVVPSEAPASDTPAPTDTDEPEPTPTEPEPTATEEPAVETPTPEPSPTEASYPDDDFADCDVMTLEQAEAILGEIPGGGFPLEWIGSNARRTALCVYQGELNGASVFIEWYFSAADARARFDNSGGGEAVSGIGDAATWNTETLYLSILRGTEVVGVEMMQADGARDQAVQIGQIAVVRIP